MSRILATASNEPSTIRTNEDLSCMVDTNDSWITARTGFKQRRIAQPDDTCATLLRPALEDVARPLIEQGYRPEDITLIIATNTADECTIPARAAELQDTLGLNKTHGNPNIPAYDIISDSPYVPDTLLSAKSLALFVEEQHMIITPREKYANRGTTPEAFYNTLRDHTINAADISACVRWVQDSTILRELAPFEFNYAHSLVLTAGCASYNFALELADRLVEQSQKPVIVGAVELNSRCVDQQDRNTVVLFGDMASATALVPGDGFTHHYLETDGSHHALISNEDDYIRLDGKRVFKWATKHALPDLLRIATEHKQDRLVIIPHQANLRMFEANPVVEALASVDDLVLTGELYGNCSTASIAHTLDLAYRQDRIRPGDTIAILGFGAGLSIGINIYQEQKL